MSMWLPKWSMCWMASAGSGLVAMLIELTFCPGNVRARRWARWCALSTVEMVLDRAQLEGEGARVAVVQHHQVEHRRGLQLAEITPAVADGAVAELERDAHGGIPVDR